MEGNSNLTFLLTVWVAVGAVILYSQWRKGAGGVGLTLMYILSLALNHWVGAAIYLLPWYSSPLERTVETGFEESTYGVIAFGIGSVIVAPLLMRLAKLPRSRKAAHQPDIRLATVYLVFALTCYVVLMPMVEGIPTVTALVASGWTVAVVGLCLKMWSTWEGRHRIRLGLWVAVAMCLPFLTLITQGFLGYGVVAMVSVLIFLARFYRPRWQIAILTTLFIYVGLSIYVTYMRDRSEIRGVVWGGESYSARLDRLVTTAINPEPFDVYNEDHLNRIDERLNQNFLVGASVNYLKQGFKDFAQGETLWQALIAVVPRAIWPDKPVFAGSGGLVTQYTGISFSEGTSVGIGQVMEFYINFGSLGVVVGFLIFGVVIAAIDRFAAMRLSEGDWQRFTFWFLPGLAFLQVIGSLVEVTATAGASLMLALLINKVLLAKLKGKKITQEKKDALPAPASLA